jgi:peptide/nickel transport system substrate-binding protein
MAKAAPSRSPAGVPRRHLLGGVALGGAAAWLAACGGEGGDEKEAANSLGQATAVSASRAPETGQPKAGGSFTTVLSDTPPLDPMAGNALQSHFLAGYVYSRLMKFKTGPDPSVFAQYETEGDLAESLEMAPDGLTATFKLRANAMFHDITPVSGRLADSEDVKISLERFRTISTNPSRAVFGTPGDPLVESVQTPDPRTFVMKLAKPFGPFRTLVANPAYLRIMPKEVAGGGMDPARQVIGTGPFALTDLQPDIAVTLKRHPTWYGAPMPYASDLRLAIIKEEAQAVSQFQAGRTDHYVAIPAEQLDGIRKAAPKATIMEYNVATYSFLYVQLRGSSPFRDERLRRAASMAIDRDAILEAFYGGRGIWLSAIPSNFGGWRVDPKSPEIGPGGQWFRYNPAEAKKLVAAAGYPNGMDQRYIFSNNVYGDTWNQSAVAVAGWLKEAGFNVTVVTQDYQSEYAKPGTGTFYGNFEGMVYGRQSPFSDPHDYLYNMFHSKSARNHSGVNDPQLDAMIDKEGTTVDPAERVKAVKEIDRYVADKVYYVPTAMGVGFIGIQEWVKGYQPSNNSYGGGAETVAKLWIDKG